MNRPTSQIRCDPTFVDMLEQAGQFEAYEHSIGLEDGGVAVGVWIQELSSVVLDDPDKSRVEIVVCREG